MPLCLDSLSTRRDIFGDGRVSPYTLVVGCVCADNDFRYCAVLVVFVSNIE